MSGNAPKKPSIVNGVIVSPVMKKKTAQARRAGMGEFVQGTGVHLSEATGLQKMKAGYMPFTGEHHNLSKTEGRILDSAFSAGGGPGGVSRPALMAGLAAGAVPPAKHLISKSLSSLEDKGLIERRGSGAGLRVKVLAPAKRRLALFKSAATVVGRLKVMGKGKRAATSGVGGGAAGSASGGGAGRRKEATKKGMQTLKIGAKVVGAFKKAGIDNKRKRDVREARLKRFNSK